MKELPAGWAWTTLGEICDKPQYGWTSSATDEHQAYRLLRTTDLSSGTIHEQSIPYCESAPPEPDKYVVRPGDIVISRAGSVGLSALVTHDLANTVFASYLIRFRPLSNVVAQYIAYYLKSPAYWSQVNQQAAGITLKNLNAAKLTQFSMPLPPFAEQRRIVAEIEKHLSKIDVASAELAAILVKVGSYVAHMFERAVSEAPHTEFRRVLAAPLANGRSVPTANSGFPVLRLTSIRNARVDLSERKIGAWSARQAEPFLVTEGDLLIVRGNGSLRLVGRAGLVQEVSSQVAFPDTLIRAKLDNTVSLPAYVARAWHTRIVRRQIEAAARTSAGIYKINQTDIENLQIPLPPRPVQEHLASAADAIESLAAQAHATIERSSRMATRLRQAILHKAFTGKLVPQDPNDEPASVLLDRICAARAHSLGRAHAVRQE